MSGERKRIPVAVLEPCDQRAVGRGPYSRLVLLQAVHPEELDSLPDEVRNLSAKIRNFPAEYGEGLRPQLITDVAEPNPTADPSFLRPAPTTWSRPGWN
jgi:hypothetical protein